MIREITITKDDFKRYSKFVCSRLTPPKARGWQPFVVNLIIWFVITAVLFTIFQSKGFSLSQFHWPTSLATSIPFFLFIVLFISNLKKMEGYSTPKENGLMLGKRTIEIDESGIKDVSSLGTSIYKWEALEEIVKHEGNIYLFLDTVLAQIIPSSAFDNQDEMEEFAKQIEVMHNKLLQPNADASAA